MALVLVVNSVYADSGTDVLFSMVEPATGWASVGMLVAFPVALFLLVIAAKGGRRTAEEARGHLRDPRFLRSAAVALIVAGAIATLVGML